MRYSLSKSATAIFLGSTIAGIGYSFGRDIYRSIKQNFILVLVIAIALLPFLISFLAGYEGVRGHRSIIRDRFISPLIAFFSVFLSAILSVLTSNWLYFIVVMAIGNQPFLESGFSSSFFQSIYDSIFSTITSIEILSQVLPPQIENPPPGLVLLIFSVSWFLPLVIGFTLGGIQRPTRKRVFSIESANDEFLDKHGFIETHEKDITHIDAEGNQLRLLETGATRFVFMQPGTRGKRAYIEIDDEGRMARYTGLVDMKSYKIRSAVENNS